MNPLRTTVPVLFCLLFACQAPPPSPQVSLAQSPEQITLKQGGQAILTYHLATQFPADSLPLHYQRSGFIHPLYSPNGKILTDDFPEGHVHQHGLFYAITNATFRGKRIDFWNQHKGWGTVRFQQLLSANESQETAGFTALHEHLAIIESDTIVAMKERWEVQASAHPHAHQVDLSSYLYPAGADTLFFQKYSYGGLGFRGSAEWNDHHFAQPEAGPKANYIGKKGKGGFLTSEGHDRISGNHTHPRWVSFHGEIDGDTAGVVIFAHPTNFRSPQAVRLHPTMPYFSVAPVVDGPFNLNPGDTLISRYRILTHDGPPDTTWIEAAYREYAAAYQPPNIVLLFADDLGYETLACNGGESYATPHLDQMAAEGMRFTQAYATPLCTPSRVQLLTGKYNDKNYIGFGLLDSTETTFAAYLQAAGYRTAITGKWQLYGNQYQRKLAGRVGSLPHQAGFEQHLLWQVQEKTGPRFKDPVLVHNGKADSTYAGKYGPDLFVAELTQFMHAADERPFLAYYPMALTHDPFRPSPDHPAYSVDSLHQKNDPQYFADNLAYMDKLVGKLLDQIRQSPNLHNTLVLFLGDNGTDRDVSSRWQGQTIAGQKGYPVQTGTHVPMIAWWPNRIQAAQTTDQLIDLTDFLPTLLQAAQVPPPQAAQLDGLSFYESLLGNPGKKREFIYCHYDPQWGKFPAQTWVQDQANKLYQDGRFYELSSDPNEQNPLNQLSPAQLARKNRWQQFMEERKASLALGT